MDAGRLLNLLFDIDDDNEEVIQGIIKSMLDSLPIQKSSDEDLLIVFADEISQLQSSCKHSYANKLSLSNIDMLKKLGANEYYGLAFLSKIEEIINLEFDSMIIRNLLMSLFKDKLEFAKNAHSARTAMQKLGISAYFSETNFEIGVIIPNGNEYCNLSKLQSLIKGLNQTAKTISEIASSDHSEIEVSCVNHGSIGIFFERAPEFIPTLSLIYNGVKNILEKIKPIEIAKANIETLDDSTDLIEQLVKKQQIIIEKEKDKISMEIISTIDDRSEEEKNEIKNKINKSIDYIWGISAANVKIEINEPYLGDPEAEEPDNEMTPEQINEINSKKIKYEKQKSIIEKSAEYVKSINSVASTIGDTVKLLKNITQLTQKESDDLA